MQDIRVALPSHTTTPCMTPVTACLCYRKGCGDMLWTAACMQGAFSVLAMSLWPILLNCGLQTFQHTGTFVTFGERESSAVFFIMQKHIYYNAATQVSRLLCSAPSPPHISEGQTKYVLYHSLLKMNVCIGGGGGERLLSLI